MLTLKEVLADAAASPGFEACTDVGVNTRGSNGESPLHWMATLGDAEAIRLLLAAGADVSLADNQGNTPLHEAVARRQTLAAQVLIAHGADVNLKNSAGQTPQDIANSDGFAPAVLLFQEGGLKSEVQHLTLCKVLRWKNNRQRTSNSDLRSEW